MQTGSRIGLFVFGSPDQLLIKLAMLIVKARLSTVPRQRNDTILRRRGLKKLVFLSARQVLGPRNFLQIPSKFMRQDLER